MTAAALLLVSLVFSEITGKASVIDDQRKILIRGKILFETSCMPCHGIDGLGRGPVATNFKTKPTNMVWGVYHNRSTFAGKTPTDYDLYHTLTSGLHHTPMPAFTRISMDDRMALVEYVKTLSPKFSDTGWYSPPDTMRFDDEIPLSVESLRAGRAAYIKVRCDRCHGIDGGGSATSSMFDDEGRTRPVIDLTDPYVYKFSEGPKDIFRITTTSLDGPKLSRTEHWNLANYTWSLRSNNQYPSILEK